MPVRVKAIAVKRYTPAGSWWMVYLRETPRAFQNSPKPSDELPVEAEEPSILTTVQSVGVPVLIGVGLEMYLSVRFWGLVGVAACSTSSDKRLASAVTASTEASASASKAAAAVTSRPAELAFSTA